jgi:hypothetical protein
MGDCRWWERGKERESAWSGGWFHRYAMCMVITVGLQTGNAVTGLPKCTYSTKFHRALSIFGPWYLHEGSSSDDMDGN